MREDEWRERSERGRETTVRKDRESKREGGRERDRGRERGRGREREHL